jgi:outer membrane immunogenic protein
MFKKAAVLLAVLLVVSGLASATSKEFYKGSFYLTPQVGFSSYGSGLPLSVNAEYALTENIGIGGTVWASFWSDTFASYTFIMISAEANYHFIKLAADKIDLYAGAGLGYGFFSESFASGYTTGGFGGSSSLTPEVILGGRYYISPKVAISLRLVGNLVGGGLYFGSTVGVTFKLK